MGRPKRRQDGTLRPAVLRGRRRRARARRTAWLDEFDPGVRLAFFDHVDMERAAFAKPTAKRLGFTEEQAELLLAKLAERAGWMTLTTRSGRVVGIGPRKP